MASEYFDRLGDAVERLWAEAGRNEEHFPQIAARVLEEMPAPTDLTAASLLQSAIAANQLVPQERLGFGEPPLTVYRGRDFYISALYWLDGTTSIHQHRFSGAFRVLEGSSLHCRYHFDERDTVTRRLVLGDLNFEEAELLKAGEVRTIVAGRPFIHSLFHLERPTVTIVIRTDGEDVGTQFNYEAPGIAWDPFYEHETLARQLFSIRTLHNVAPDDAIVAARSFIDRTDVWAGFLLLQNWFGTIGRGEVFFDLVDHAVRRYGNTVDDLRPMFETLDRRYELIFRRRFIHDPEHRLFLALLMNLPDATSVTTVLKQAFPDEAPATLIADWLEDLCSPALQGSSGLRLPPETLARIRAGLDDEGQASDALAALNKELELPNVLSSLFR